MKQSEILLSPILRFRSSKNRKVLEDFLNSEAGQAFLLTLPHYRPPMNTTVNPNIHGQHTSLEQVRSDACSQNIGFQRCFESILDLTKFPPQPTQSLPQPDYKSDPLSDEDDLSHAKLKESK